MCIVNEALGIDFGMENLKVAYFNGKTVHTLNISANQDEKTTPNIVYYEKNEDGELKKYFGSNQKSDDAARSGNEDCIKHIKRKLQLLNWSSSVCGGEFPITAESVITDILSYVYEQTKIIHVENYPTVVTVPVMYSEVQKNIMKKCALNAGFKDVVIITEPFAALFSPELTDAIDSASGSRNIVVFDFGGSTLDICLMRAVQKRNGHYLYKILGSGGIKFGGVDITNLIKEKILAKNPDINAEIEKRINAGRSVDILNSELIRSADEFKKRLSDESKVRGRCLGIDIEMSEKDIERILDEAGLKKRMEKTLNDIFSDTEDEISVTDIAEVHTIGGTSRLRYIQDFIEEYFGDEPAGDIDDDDYIYNSAAMGAAKYLSMSQEVDIACPPSMSFGIEDEDGNFKTVIFRNTFSEKIAAKGRAVRISHDRVIADNYTVRLYQSTSKRRIQSLDSEDICFAGFFRINREMLESDCDIIMRVLYDSRGKIYERGTVYAEIFRRDSKGNECGNYFVPLECGE